MLVARVPQQSSAEEADETAKLAMVCMSAARVRNLLYKKAPSPSGQANRGRVLQFVIPQRADPEEAVPNFLAQKQSTIWIAEVAPTCADAADCAVKRSRRHR